jgi:hypothetical protein
LLDSGFGGRLPGQSINTHSVFTISRVQLLKAVGISGPFGFGLSFLAQVE